MIHLNNVQVKHNGLMADNSTKMTIYCPELTLEQHTELIKVAREKVIGIIFVEPEMMEDISSLIKQAKSIVEESPDISDYGK